MFLLGSPRETATLVENIKKGGKKPRFRLSSRSGVGNPILFINLSAANQEIFKGFPITGNGQRNRLFVA